MAIVYRTSDTIDVEEIDIDQAPRFEIVARGTFHANYLRLQPTIAADGRMELGTNSFAVYTNTKGDIHHAVVATYEPDAKKRTNITLVRAWQTSAARLDSVVAQLVRNKGVLDEEYTRVAIATHNFQYNMMTDLQKDALYAAEDQLPKPAKHLLRAGRTPVYLEKLNADRRMEPTDHGYAMSSGEAVDFGEQVFADYGIHDIRLEAGTRPGAAASCMIRDVGKRMRLFHRGYDMVLGFSPDMPIGRGIILHEIAHALDLREFGGFSHGPTFVLTYCELLSKYTSINFATALDTFINAGLKVANPIHSDEFHTLPKWRRAAFRKTYQESVDQLSRNKGDEVQLLDEAKPVGEDR